MFSTRDAYHVPIKVLRGGVSRHTVAKLVVVSPQPADQVLCDTHHSNPEGGHGVSKGVLVVSRLQVATTYYEMEGPS